MKHIIVAEMLYPKGHKTLNKRYLEILASRYIVTVVDYNNYFGSMEIENKKIDLVKTNQFFPTFSMSYPASPSNCSTRNCMSAARS